MQQNVYRDEQEFKAHVTSYIQSCRSGDWEHAQRVVAWVKQLGTGRSDIATLVRAAYVHDIGWAGILKSKLLSLEKLKQYEGLANQQTEPKIREVFTALGFEEKEIKTVIRLVAAADKHQANKDDEAIIVDADNLSKLDINHLKEKFKPESWPEMIQWLEKMLPKRITTERGKKVWPQLLQELKNKIKNS